MKNSARFAIVAVVLLAPSAASPHFVLLEPTNMLVQNELGDPRKAIDERYASKEDYLARVRTAAETLVRGRYMLAEDIEPVVAVAGRKWDAFRGT